MCCSERLTPGWRAAVHGGVNQYFLYLFDRYAGSERALHVDAQLVGPPERRQDRKIRCSRFAIQARPAPGVPPRPLGHNALKGHHELVGAGRSRRRTRRGHPAGLEGPFRTVRSSATANNSFPGTDWCRCDATASGLRILVMGRRSGLPPLPPSRKVNAPGRRQAIQAVRRRDVDQPQAGMKTPEHLRVVCGRSIPANRCRARMADCEGSWHEDSSARLEGRVQQPGCRSLRAVAQLQLPRQPRMKRLPAGPIALASRAPEPLEA